MHLNDADLAAALDPSGGGAGGHSARAHAATCEACTTAIETAQAADREVGDLLRLLDHPVPSLDATFLDAPTISIDRTPVAAGATGRAGIGRALKLGTARRPAPSASVPDVERRGVSTWAVAARRGAVILALSAAAAAAAAPRSPVRQFIARIVARPRQSAPVVVPPTVVTANPPVLASPRGVAIAGSEKVELVFQTPEPSSVVRIRPTTGTQVSVTASTDGPTYTVGSGAIVVDSHATRGVTYDVELPPANTLPRVSIRVGTRVIFARAGNSVHVEAEPQAGGVYVVPLVR
jgi:hypothetical protein